MNDLHNSIKARDLLLTLVETLEELRELSREDGAIRNELDLQPWPGDDNELNLFDDFAYQACEAGRYACKSIIHEMTICSMQNILICSGLTDIQIMNAIEILRDRERKRLELDGNE